jgi:hypothetical protein
MALFDPNQWYHIYVNQDDKFALKGTSLYKQSMYGATYFEKADLDKPWQRWQMYNVENTTDYVMRTKDSGPDGFFSTQFSSASDLEGQIYGTLIRGNISDGSVYWQWTSWTDGTFYLTNKRNDTGWHLSERNTATVM